MARFDNSQRQSTATALLWGGAVVASLYFAREVLLPFALAVLFSFLVAPLVDWLERWRFPRVSAVLTVVVFGFAALGAFGYVVFAQVYDLAYRLPEYESNLTDKAKLFQGNGHGVLSHVASVFDHIQKNLKTESDRASALATDADAAAREHSVPQGLAAEPFGSPSLAAAAPIPVQIVESISPGAVLPRVATYLGGPWVRRPSSSCWSFSCCWSVKT